MIRYVHKLCFIASTALLLCSCKKQPVALPEATHTGQNTVACYTNGTPFIVFGHAPTGMGFFNDGVGYYLDTDSMLTIKALSWSDQSIQLYVKYSGLGTYSITPNNSTQPTYNNAYYNDTGVVSYSGTNGSVTIDYYDGNILAGKFAFDSRNASGNIVYVTNGEFDIGSK